MAASMEYFPREEEVDDDLILANFSHGRLNVNEDGSCLQPPSFSYFKHKDQADKRRKNQRILVAESNSMQYIGQNFGNHAPRLSSHCKYLVGILDKESGKMKIYDAQSHLLRPWFGDSNKASELTSEGAQEILTYSEKNDRLTEAFGSSRKQRALESRLRSAVTPKALEALANKAIEHSQSQPQISNPSDDEDDNGGILPPCNQKAEVLKDVYNLDDIISPWCMKIVEELPATSEFIEATDEQITEWKTQEKYCEYILDHLKRLPTPPEQRQEAACILIYIHYLRKISAMDYRHLKSKDVFVDEDEDLPESFTEHLLDKFTKMSASLDGVRSRRCFPKQLREKSLIHMLTLALILDEFTTDLRLLQVGLKAQLNMLRNHARALGCKVKEGKSTTPQKSTVKTQSKSNCVTAELLLPRKNKYRPTKRTSSR